MRGFFERELPEPGWVPGREVATLYYTKGGVTEPSEVEVADLYLAETSRRCWVLEDEAWYGIGRQLTFGKGAEGVHVSVEAVGRYLLPERPPRIRLSADVRVTQAVPSRDVGGGEIEGVPRFPGSVRFYHLRVATDHVVKYKAVGTVDEAEWFFVEELPGHGWSFAGNDATGLLFVPAGTAASATEAFASGQLVPATRRVTVDDAGHRVLKVGLDRARGG